MSHWLLDSVANERIAALAEADRIQFLREMTGKIPAFDVDAIQKIAEVAELAVLDLDTDRLSEDTERRSLSRKAAADAFRLLRVLPTPKDALAHV